VIINMFIKYKHPVDRDIYVWLQKLGIPTQWLEIKEDKIALL
jgi:hypothetical protein